MLFSGIKSETHLILRRKNACQVREHLIMKASDGGYFVEAVLPSRRIELQLLDVTCKDQMRINKCVNLHAKMVLDSSMN